ncbi:hypothetical protein M758_4G156400 [Ceratodon purpureus]|nr:hypothetical protein M758_4G156400 [Ceratodon purpureus]
MAGPKASDDEAGQELCDHCGMPPCKVDPTISVTLLFSKATRQVLCLEAGKDFVDTLMGFLTLPIGCIIKLLEAASMIHRPECKLAPPPSVPLVFPPGLPYSPSPKKTKNAAGEHFAMTSIANILDSVVKLNDRAMAADKNCLVDPKPATPFGAGKLLYLNNTPRTSSTRSTQRSGGATYYACGNACSLYATTSATKCPKHKKKMSVPLKLVEANVTSARGTAELSDENFQDQRDRTDSVPITREQRGRQNASASANCATKPVQRPASRRSIRGKCLDPAFDSESPR